jgi:hypothetical protein
LGGEETLFGIKTLDPSQDLPKATVARPKNSQWREMIGRADLKMGVWANEIDTRADQKIHARKLIARVRVLTPLFKLFAKGHKNRKTKGLIINSPVDTIIMAKSSERLDLGAIGVGLMQWGTTNIDDKVVNPKGNLSESEVRDIWTSCREHNIVFFDTAEGRKAANYRKTSHR